MPSSDPISVALTVEQSWHRVPGGTAVAALGLARALLERDDVSVIGVAAAHRSRAPEDWQPPVPVRHLPLPRPLLYESWHRLRWPAVESATGPVSVIHATTMAMPPRRAPVVMTVHDLAFLHEPSHFTSRGLRFFRRGLQLALEEADVIVCPSRATARDAAAAGFDPGRTHVVPLGVDASPVSAEHVSTVRAKHGLDRPYVLWTGTIEPRKNLPRLIEAFRALDGEVLLALAGPEGWNEDLEALTPGLQGRVHALGFVPHSELGALYAGAEVFCFPSLLEGFGFPVLEAMAQGTPVVTSAGTSTEEVVGDAGVLVNPLDAGSIEAGLRSVLEDPGLAARLGDAGRARAATYTWTSTASALVDVYREVAG